MTVHRRGVEQVHGKEEEDEKRGEDVVVDSFVSLRLG